MLVLRKESGDDGSAAVVNAENQRTVDHLQNEEITAAVHGHEDARYTTRLDFHADVDVQTDTERFLRLDVTAVGSKEGTVFHFGGTRLRTFRVNRVADWSTVGSVIQNHVNSFHYRYELFGIPEVTHTAHQTGFDAFEVVASIVEGFR
jgi:hypothetical protein